MRSEVQEIFKMTPHDKQVMMFSATLSQDMRTVCKKFMTNVRYTQRSAERQGPCFLSCMGPAASSA